MTVTFGVVHGAVGGCLGQSSLPAYLVDENEGPHSISKLGEVSDDRLADSSEP